LEEYKISVVIPVKNGAATLDRCLFSLRNQTIGKQLEIIVEDSMSEDESRDIALHYSAKVFDVLPGTFNHGLTRNDGVRHATGDLIYFTVQDAWVGSTDMIEKMARHFDDPEVMGVMGHQAIPHEKDKNPFLWYKPYSAPGITEKVIADTAVFQNLSQPEQQSLIGWDNVVAMYRKSALLEQPFEETEYAEDWIWSYRALLKGWKLLHDSSLVGYHYHHQDYKYVFNSVYTANYHFYKFFKYRPKLPALLIPMARVSYHLLKNKELSFREKLYWIMHNVSGRIANYSSTLNFLRRLKANGEQGIEKGYNKYCKVIPQGKLK
jgi:rhamnosyltransferase